MSRSIRGPIEGKLIGAKILVSQEFQEDATSRGTFEYVPPYTVASGIISFTNCTGGVTTLSPASGGTLSAVGVPVVVKYCTTQIPYSGGGGGGGEVS